jgi:hypothetical protein
METQTQQQDIGQQLQEAVLRAAMPAEDAVQASSEEGLKNAEKQALAVGAGAPGPGRPKGTPNKATKTIRDAVMQAFDEVGGPAYLVRLAQGTQSDRAAFTSLLNKVLPTQINANVEGGIQVQLSWLGGRNIGTTTAQPVEQVTQVVDLERDSAGKYRIKDPVDAVSPGADGSPAIDDQGKTAQNDAGDAQGA